MDLALIIPAVVAGGVVVAVATLWASFGPSTKPISALIQGTASLSNSADPGHGSPHCSPRKKKKTSDDSRPPSGPEQDGQESEQRTDRLTGEVGEVESSPRQQSELSSSSSSEDVPGVAARQSMLASAMMDAGSSGVRQRVGAGGEESREHDEWVIVGEGQAPPTVEQ